MRYEIYSHRFADIILNSDYSLKIEMEGIIGAISFDEIEVEFKMNNAEKEEQGKRAAKGKQSTINAAFKKRFVEAGWEQEKNVFNDPQNDLVIDFWRRKVGVDVAFNHRSFIGGDLLRLQAAAEVKNVINVGVYICATKPFLRQISPSDAASMVSFERTQWFLQNFYSVLTVPIYLVGLTG